MSEFGLTSYATQQPHHTTTNPPRQYLTTRTLNLYPSWHTIQVNPVSSSRFIISDIHSGVLAALAAAAAAVSTLAVARAAAELSFPAGTAGAPAFSPPPDKPTSAAPLAVCMARQAEDMGAF